MKHICLFSGGAASAHMSQIVADIYGKENTILLHTPTYSEHQDADRFRTQVSRRIGIPITEQADGRDIWQLIDDEHCLPSQFIPFCTRILKQEQSEKFYKTLNEDFIIYAGYGAEETGRVQKQTMRFEAMGYKSRYVLHDFGITGELSKNIIRNELKICLPEPYKYLKHNNCIPCFKGGIGHFYDVWRYYPDRFQMAVEKEKQIGHTVFKEKSLEEYAKMWSKLKGQMTFLDEDYGIPCLCAL